jgi:hypothetical protein
MDECIARIATCNAIAKDVVRWKKEEKIIGLYKFFIHYFQLFFRQIQGFAVNKCGWNVPIGNHCHSPVESRNDHGFNVFRAIGREEKLERQRRQRCTFLERTSNEIPDRSVRRLGREEHLATASFQCLRKRFGMVRRAGAVGTFENDECSLHARKV